MIITCVNCKKKFEVDSSLIPENGRNIQCGSCNHIWFYKPTEFKEKINDNSTKQSEFNPTEVNKKKIEIKNENIINDYPKKREKSKSKSNFNFGQLIFRTFSLLIVLIISFIAIVIFLDTLKLPLSNFFPNLELVLFNLYETLEDIFLFSKNLIL